MIGSFRRLFGALLWLALLAGPALAQAAEEARDPYQYFFSESFGDFREELAAAREQGKKGVMLFFEMDECPFCHRMKQTILNRPDVQAYFRERFIGVSVDVEGDVEITDFEGRAMSQKDYAFKVNRVRATPVIAFFDLEGKRVVRYTGATSSAEEFLWLVDYAADGRYRDLSFTKYKRERRNAAK
ncbi:thioredoxin family protein [Endothiovibrio diazotrophicus]